ncbi:MAG: holo-ACP synthase [Candidatus Pelagibacter sp.]|jgi:holo-[acyl-carrier protein] synthase|tara:strand:- start:312 stop:698 length:387 start_codon:yes stop_codon:yes gene_type:complete
MRILGIGVDIIQNKRIKSSIKNKLFVSRTFGNKEIYFSKNISDKTNYFAKRFAAKEALAKSIGTGFRNNLNFKDIQILNDKIGKPYYQKSKKIDKIINKKFKVKTYDLFLSISDEKDYSIAFTILQTK